MHVGCVIYYALNGETVLLRQCFAVLPLAFLIFGDALISVLQKKAEKFELKKLQVLKVTKELVLALEPLLQDVYASRRPKPTDYEVRKELIRVFNEMAKEIYGKSKDVPVVVEFGSFVMDLFSTTSDLDLSVNFSTTTVPVTAHVLDNRQKQSRGKGHVCKVLPITTAKVPIVKCVDRGTGVECDISVENRDGILKSQIIHIISSIDERFHKLSFLMKTWAKANNINSSKDKTLNSLSIILLVAFHLQTRDPPILPPFSAIFKGNYSELNSYPVWLPCYNLSADTIPLFDGTDPATVEKSLSNFVNYGKRNTESLAGLFVTLLIKLSSVEKLWAKGLCASTCSGTWISKTWDAKVTCISVEDFTDQSQNVARAVGQAEVKQIYKCIDTSIRYIFSFMDGQIGPKLMDLLFGQDGIPTPIGRAVTGKRKKQVTNTLTNRILQMKNKEQVEQAIVESSSTKRMRTTESLRVMPNGNWGSVHVEARVGTQPPMGGLGVGSYGGGWEGTQQPGAGGWGVARQPGAGGWDGTQQSCARGWEETRQPGAGGWVGTQQPVAQGWEGIRQPGAGGWVGTQQPGARGLEGIRQPGIGGWVGTGQSGAGGWEETRQPGAGGWGGTQQPGARGWEGIRQPGAGGWVGTHQPGAGGWGGTQQPGAQGWAGIRQPGAGGWVGTQQPGAHGLEGTGQPRGGSWVGTQQPGAGGWGGTGQPAAGGWGRWEGSQQHMARGWGGTSSNPIWGTTHNTAQGFSANSW
ncbi:hypothetical protein DH2020_003242 [Rehmannia glutinosa]|uniref:Poly(A) RNA polymerase mitochondrial-like central palm domain-containing protein n=1 Tax=Rehmannia glutinosa TaxID=99300 RepID=A0ABR0XL34_REHGL